MIQDYLKKTCNVDIYGYLSLSKSGYVEQVCLIWYNIVSYMYHAMIFPGKLYDLKSVTITTRPGRWTH